LRRVSQGSGGWKQRQTEVRARRADIKVIALHGAGGGKRRYLKAGVGLSVAGLEISNR